MCRSEDIPSGGLQITNCTKIIPKGSLTIVIKDPEKAKKNGNTPSL
jgi:hypothetical protein